MKTKIVLSLFGMSLCSVSFAANVLHSSPIKAIYPLANGSFILRLVNEAPTCPSTTTPKAYYVQVGQNAVTADALPMLYAASLAAAAQGLPITIFFDDSTTSCFVQRLSINYQ